MQRPGIFTDDHLHAAGRTFTDHRQRRFTGPDEVLDLRRRKVPPRTSRSRLLFVGAEASGPLQPVPGAGTSISIVAVMG
jgi:hypothetical protein